MRLTMKDRVGLGLIATGLTLSGFLNAACMPKAPTPNQGSAEAPPRLPTADELYACEMAKVRNDGPATGDCTRFPKHDTIHEDDPWGRWDCATMGNKKCGPDGPDEANMTADELSEHDSFNAMRAQLKELGQWEMTADEDNRYRAEFVSNSLADPNRGRLGYLQAEDGSWVPESFYR